MHSVRYDNLQKRIAIYNNKLIKLYSVRDFETRIEEKMRLDELIKDIEQDLKNIQQELEEKSSVFDNKHQNNYKKKNNRYMYIGLFFILLIIISLFMSMNKGIRSSIFNMNKNKLGKDSYKVFEPLMIPIPAGTFEMGCKQERDDVGGGCADDEKPLHLVNIKSFEIGKYAVTFNEYDECTLAGACPVADDSGWGRGSRPVINVSWQDTQIYLNWLNQKTGAKYRLPTEAEWEYVARSDTETAYPWGKKPSREYANYGSDFCCSGYVEGSDKWLYTAPVDSFQPNFFGVFNMVGNTKEWVQDCYKENYNDVLKDGTALEFYGCDKRVVRVGSWASTPTNLRSANRSKQRSIHRDSHIGFRIAK